MAFSQRPVTVRQIFNAEALSASGTASSVKIDLKQIAQNGYFSIYYTITGSGTIKLEYLLSYDEEATFLEPAGADDIATLLSSGSGLVTFSPELAAWIQIKATEDGGASAATISAWMHIQ